ncbi:hypothetical protein [Rhizobium straminoryzae]|uniref:Hydratase n=1 Tax=Rhizobium straminoryzae TaxID=1387186 RepID=A0A549TAC5_9HYPH|nr:hypothetical protein [Rhizobium straminoryzae]TRL38818.1 hypothetical protein FNA46_11700 [Rhizobium straminoryzae]
MSDHSHDTEISNAAAVLLAAIRNRTTVGRDTVAVSGEAEGYAVQSALAGALGLVTPPGYKLSLRTDVILAAPLLFVREAPQAEHEPGIKVEIELALTLSEDLPPRDEAYRREDVLDAIGSVAIGVELVRSRYVDGPRDSLAHLLADGMSNVGYLVGPMLDRDLLAPGADLGPLLLTNEGTVLFEDAARHPDGDPLAAVLVAANAGLPMGGYLRKGQVVTTGTLSGAPVIPAPSRFTVELGGQVLTVTLSA